MQQFCDPKVQREAQDARTRAAAEAAERDALATSLVSRGGSKAHRVQWIQTALRLRRNERTRTYRGRIMKAKLVVARKIDSSTGGCTC